MFSLDVLNEKAVPTKSLSCPLEIGITADFQGTLGQVDEITNGPWNEVNADFDKVMKECNPLAMIQDEIDKIWNGMEWS